MMFTIQTKANRHVGIFTSILVILISCLLARTGQGQSACGTGLGGTIGLSDTNGVTIDSSSHVKVGDVILVSLLEVQNQDSSYMATGIVARVVFPDGSSQVTMNIPSLRPGASCNPATGGLQGLH